MDVPAAAVLEQIGGEFGDDDRDLIDASAWQPDATGEIADQPTGFRNLARIGNCGEHATSNAPE